MIRIVTLSLAIVLGAGATAHAGGPMTVDFPTLTFPDTGPSTTLSTKGCTLSEVCVPAK